ncbi:MAG: hypothetical protein JWO33_674 [Caulobacteraceae bacterium]|nr:hypothetical protein [Caulobacteraceae bacterium]
MSLRAVLGLLLGLVVWTAGLGPAQAATVPATEAADAGRQVLVLLRLPAEHFHAGSDYAGGFGDGAGLAARRRIAARLAREHGLVLVTGWPMPLLGVDCFVMAAPAGRSPDQVAALLARDPDVAWSEPMHSYRAQGQGQAQVQAKAEPHVRASAAAPDDPLFRAQPAAREWRLADLHQIATGRGVRVAVIDSAVDAAHPDLAGQLQTRRNFVAGRPDVAEQHGTAVAGIVAALADNRLGVAGVAPGARLMALRACWNEPRSPATICDTLSLAKALHFAIDHDARVINLSLSGPPDLLLGRLLDLAMARGATVVGAIDPDLAGGGFPANHAGVVAVTDDPRGGGVAGAYLAPGRDVPTTQPGGGWGLVTGSSYSAAHVSGLFALLRQRSPRASLVTLRAGGGAIDACATLLRAAAPCAGCACAQAASYSALVRQ